MFSFLFPVSSIQAAALAAAARAVAAVTAGIVEDIGGGEAFGFEALALFAGLLGCQRGEDALPLVLAGRTVKGGEHEHQHLGAHADRQQRVAAGKVQDFEERAPDDDCGAYRVGEVEEALPFFAGYEGADAAAHFFHFLVHC